MKERLKEFISHLGMSDRAFAISCGITQNTLSRQLGGVREISLATIVAVTQRYPELSMVWLLTGRGTMLPEEHVQPEEPVRNDREDKLIDTIAFQQKTINELNERLSDLESRNKRLTEELVMLKNERSIS